MRHLHPLPLDRIVGRTDTSSIRKMEHQVSELHRITHHIPGCPGRIRNDTPLKSGKQIHQGRLADIGTANNRSVDPFPDHPSSIVGRG